MGKTGKWIKNFLSGKKEKEKVIYGGENEQPTTPISVTQKDKKRWSFRRSSAAAPQPEQMRELSSAATTPNNAKHDGLESDHDQKKHALAVAAATAAAADAAAAAAKGAAAVIQLTAVASGGCRASSVSAEAAATKIQSVFRGYLARKALNALKGLVKLQALVRGHLVRKQAAATLRCMQALITAQARARAQRLKMAEDQENPNNQRPSVHRKSIQENRFRHSFKDYDSGLEENIKIVEMDLGESKGSTKSRNSYSNQGQTEHRFSSYNPSSYSNQETPKISPSPSAITDQSPRAISGHFEDYSAQSSPQCFSTISKPDPPRIPIPYAKSEYSDSIYNDYPFYPSYMANTESSRAKVRSHSVPKQRPETPERPPSRRRPSIEGRNVPRAVRMQRSSSHVGSGAQNYQYPWSIKLDRSNISLKDSECGSSCSVLTTNTVYCRPVVGFDVQGNRY